MTAPLWLIGDVETGFRLVQAENVVAMCSAAAATYLLARTLKATRSLAGAVAALSVVGPQMMFAGMILSEPFAYPLSVWVVFFALRAFTLMTIRSQVALTGFAALATFARVQLAVLPLCVAVALIVSGALDHRLGMVLRRLWLFLSSVLFATLAGALLILVHGLGYYHVLPTLTSLSGAAGLAGVDAYVLIVATGVATIPSALAALARGVGGPATDRERFYCLMTTFIALALVAQCVLWGDVHRVQERYLAYLVPLLGVAFALRQTQRRRRLIGELTVAAALAAVAAALPLTAQAIDAARFLAPTLYAFEALQLRLHSVPLTAAIFAVGVTALAFTPIVTARSRWTRQTTLVLSASSSLLMLLGAVTWSAGLARDARSRYLPADREWVDHASSGDATMLVVGAAWRGHALATLFWNRSVTRVVRAEHGAKIDELESPVADVSSSGRLTIGGDALYGRIVTESSPLSTVSMLRARSVEEWGPATLWQLDGSAHLGAIVSNRLPDGRIRPHGNMRVWGGSQAMKGYVVVEASAPIVVGDATIVFGDVNHHVRARIPSGRSMTMRVPVCTSAPWIGGFTASPIRVTPDGQWRSIVLGVPKYVPDASACRAGRRS